MVLAAESGTDRLSCQGICSIQSGIVFMDALTHLERAADQCSSIAMTMLGRNNEAIMSNHHDYLHELTPPAISPYLAEQARAQGVFVPLQQRSNTTSPPPLYQVLRFRRGACHKCTKYRGIFLRGTTVGQTAAGLL